MDAVDIKIWNIEGNRFATLDEIAYLVDIGLIRIDYYVIGDNVGKICIEIDDTNYNFIEPKLSDPVAVQ